MSTTTTDTTADLGYVMPEEADEWTPGKGIKEAVARLRDALPNLVEVIAGTASNSNAVAYAIAALRRNIVDANGAPNWSGKGNLYQANYEGMLTSILEERYSGEENKDVRATLYRKVRENARQALSRAGILEAEIVSYCLATMNNAPKLADLQWTAVKGDADDPNAAPALLTGKVPAPLKAAVKKEYERAGIVVPEKFGGPKRGSGSGGGDRTSESKVAALHEVATVIESGDVPVGEDILSETHRFVSFVIEATRKQEVVPGGKENAASMFDTFAAMFSDGASLLRGKYPAGSDFDKVSAHLASLAWKPAER